MDTCFFCHQAIENEDEYILIGSVQDQVVELVPAHQDCTNFAPPLTGEDLLRAGGMGVKLGPPNNFERGGEAK
jgi:hypothetical protein